MERLIGKKLDGRYIIKEIVGIGGMAVVYKATDVLTDMTVAIKILKDEYLSNEEFCQRFRNESKAIALLNHKNIVKVYDVSNSEYLQYIVMEYIDGITLKDYIDQEGRLSCKEAVHFTTQILKALQHAHDRGIVHRDVKPQNIMLLENGEIKVTDFGIARVKGNETVSSSGSKSTIGSVHYISPEQASGSQTDARADIYSVGVMLYEMLTGQLPFDAENTVSVAVMHLQADPRMPRQINPDIPEALEEIIMQAMQKDMGHRYQSANQMLMDIDAFKRDPHVHFEYRYMSDDTPTRYINAVYNSRRIQEEQIENEKSPVIPVLAGIASAFALVAIVMIWLVLDESGFFHKNSAETGMVPNFVGSNYEEVVADDQYDYAFVIEWAFSNDYAENVIMNQSPKAGRNAFNNTKVTLTVSKGVERLLVPEFDNMTYDEYSEECIKLNVKPTKLDVYSDT
ncbi:MAG: Stk1 family PASTA domain-containing Ser/Thr kinase, partial [Clostridia bacterium]|nr:Stk1 family PASTA domain-containing Ser/Thr kinase [Clostridia bacterium]